MYKKFIPGAIIAAVSLIVLIVLGLDSFYGNPGNNMPESGIIHTYLVKIPNSAGVCPYALTAMTKGKLKVVDDPECVCPYNKKASYMTTRCRDIKSVIAMLPERIQNKIQVRVVDETVKKTGAKIL